MTDIVITVLAWGLVVIGIGFTFALFYTMIKGVNADIKRCERVRDWAKRELEKRGVEVEQDD